MPYLYLHGFASGPKSTKARFLQQQFQSLGKDLRVLDLNQGDFFHLSLTRQIQQVRDVMQTTTAPWVIIGSSFGGLTAAWLTAEPDLAAHIQQAVLLAPAFDFLSQWLPRLGNTQLQQWRETGSLPIYHYGEQRYWPLAYDFILDAQSYDESRLQPTTAILILHGRQDEVIDVQVSRNFAARHDRVELIELDSDHALASAQDEIWQAIRHFLAL